MATERVTASVSSDDAGTGWLSLKGSRENVFSVQVGGSFVATVTIQMKRAGAADNTAVPMDGGTIDAPIGKRGVLPGAWEVRAFVVSGDYVSGTAELAIYHDG